MVMLIDQCLGAAVAEGRLTQQQANDFKIAFRRAEAATPASGAQAYMANLAAAAQNVNLAAVGKQRQAALQILALQQAIDDAMLSGSLSKGVADLMVRPLFTVNAGQNLEIKEQVERGILRTLLGEQMEAWRRKAAGFTQDRAGPVNLIKELYGVSSGDRVAAAGAPAWEKTVDYALDRLEAAGVAISRRDDWRFPQRWDRDSVSRQGKDAFAAYMESRYQSGDLRIGFGTGIINDVNTRAKIFHEAFDDIATDGLASKTPGSYSGLGSFGDYTKPRVFTWTSADAWLDWNRKYGTGDAGIFDTMTAYLDGLARDIALADRFGPKPNTTVRTLIDLAAQEAAQTAVLNRKSAERAARKTAYWLETYWMQVNGTSSTAVDRNVAQIGTNIRTWLQASQLGSAVISSTADFATLRLTASWNNLPATQVIARYVSLLNPANEADRMLALRHGLILDVGLRRFSNAAREGLDGVADGIIGKAGDSILRLSGMPAHTEALRTAFGLEFQGHLADLADTSFANMPEALRKQFERYNIDSQMWDTIRQNGVVTYPNGTKYLNPTTMVLNNAHPEIREAGIRIQSMIMRETDFAVPNAGARERALLLRQTRAGEGWGEIFRGFAQYKAFPVFMVTSHMMRGFQGIREGDKGLYLAAMVVMLTASGALAMQLKEIAKGRDPRDTTDPKFWGQAFIQGGGIGIWGDFLNGSITRAGNDAVVTWLGPTAGLLVDLIKLTGANVGPLTDEKDAHFGRDVSTFVRRNTPLLSSLWYTRLAADRLLFDRLQMNLDPQYGEAFARLQQKIRKENNQSFYWAPGRSGPSRAPDFNRIAP